MLGDVFTFLLFVILSRVFGQEGIGKYSFAMAFTGLFAVFAEFGLQSFSIKELSRLDSSIGANYGRFFTLGFIMSVIAFGMLLLVLPFLPFDGETKLIIILIGAFQVIYRLADGFTGVFISRGETHVAGLVEILFRAVTALSGIAVIIAGGTLVMAVAALPAIASAQLLAEYWLVAKKHGKPGITASWLTLLHTMREAVPYALSTFLFQLYSRIDVVFLGFFLGEVASGVYNVAYRVLLFVRFIPHFVGVSLFPLLSRMYHLDSRDELKALYNKSLNYVILIGLPAAGGLWLIAPDLINLIFGKDFSESGSLLRLLSWLLFTSFLSTILVFFLVSCDLQVKVLREQGIVALVNVVGNLILIPTVGIKGAAIATLASETLLVILLAIQLRPVLGWPRIGSRLVIGSVAVATFWIPFMFLPKQSLVVVIPSSVLLYFATLILFKEIRKNEVRMLISLLKQKS